MSPCRPRAAGDRPLSFRTRRPRLDREVLALLCDEPDLLAIADAVAATQDDSEQPNAPGAEPGLGTDGGLALD